MSPPLKRKFDRQSKYRVGFTLAELLIALAILGIIATFTIPKILSAQAEQKKRAILKECYATVTSLFIEGRRSGDIPADQSNVFIDYIAAKMNYPKRS